MSATASEEREAMKLLGVAILFQFGLNAARPFLTLFIVNEIGTRGWPDFVNSIPGLAGTGLGGADASSLSQLLAGFFIVMTAVWVLPCGALGDRFGKKRIFAVGLLVVGVVALFAAFATTVPQLLFYLLFLGFGNAAVSILFFPYLSDLVAPKRIGEFQGLSATAETLGVFGGGVAAGFLIDWNPYGLHYRLSFITTAVFLLLAVGAVAFVKARLVEAQGTPLTGQAGI
jgi:MFS family permease